MPTPVIFLAFANQKDAYLEKLKKERKTLEEMLFEADRKGQIELKTEAETDIQDIFNVFDKFRGRIKIFHYAGHANGTHLELEDKQANGQALADLIREERGKNGQGLELVFLNGCATEGQVAKLLEAGVKSVIATSVAIEDERASAFAQQFYQSLASGADIQEAYRKASSFLKIQSETVSPALMHLGEVRSLGSLQRNKQTDAFPWALYLPDQKPASTWKIPPKPRRLSDRLKVFLYLLVPLLTLGIAYFWYQYQYARIPVNLTVRLENLNPNPELPEPQGQLMLSYGDKTETQSAGDKETIFKGIPSNFRGESVKLHFEAEGFASKDTSFPLSSETLVLPVERNQDLARIIGYISDADGPVEGASINMQNLEVLTNASGYFELEIPFAQQKPRQRLSIFKEGYQSQELETPVIPNEPLRLILDKK